MVGAEDDGEGRVDGEFDDEDEYEDALSLAAMEAELKPKVLETFRQHCRHVQEAAQVGG